MKRLTLVGLRACERCHRAIAYLMSEDGEHTLGIALDAIKAREMSRKGQETGQEKFLTDLLLQSLASSPNIPREIVLDFHEEGFLYARVDLTTEIITCSAQEGVAFAAATGTPLNATERIFEHIRLFHPPHTESEGTDLVQLKPKPTLH
jgi:hypothetical protein